MIVPFVTMLFITFVFVRVTAHLLHDHVGYEIGNDRSKTITGWLRRKTGLDWHHIHIGAIVLIIVVPAIIFSGMTFPRLFSLGIGLSLVADQLAPLLKKGCNYFSKTQIMISFTLHLIITGVALTLMPF